MKTSRAPRPAPVASRLPTLSALLAGGMSLLGCATEADTPPTVTPMPVHTAGAEAVVTPVQPQPPIVPPEPVPLGGAPMPVTALPPPPPPPPHVQAHSTVRLIAR